MKKRVKGKFAVMDEGVHRPPQLRTQTDTYTWSHRQTRTCKTVSRKQSTEGKGKMIAYNSNRNTLHKITERKKHNSKK